MWERSADVTRNAIWRLFRHSEITCSAASAAMHVSPVAGAGLDQGQADDARHEHHHQHQHAQRLARTDNRPLPLLITISTTMTTPDCVSAGNGCAAVRLELQGRACRVVHACKTVPCMLTRGNAASIAPL